MVNGWSKPTLPFWTNVPRSSPLTYTSAAPNFAAEAP